jgi:hypothetical protein
MYAIFGQVPVNSAESHQINASFKFWIGACNNWLSAWNNYLSHYGPLVHFVISSNVLSVVTAQITPATIKRWLRPNPKVPFTFIIISVLLAHANAISCNSVNICLWFFLLTPWPLPIRKCSKNTLQMRGKSWSYSRIISFLTRKCSDDDRLMGKISLHQILMRLWCYLTFSNADSAYPLVNSSALSFEGASTPRVGVQWGFKIQPKKHSSLLGSTKYWNFYKTYSKTLVAGYQLSGCAPTILESTET